jgi:hypothetical protein
MPLDTLEDYERLGEHPTAIDAPLEAFAAAHGYAVIRHGHYPNRRITREESVVRSIHISMDMDERGQRFDHFFPDIPYIVWGGAWVDDFSIHTRFASPHIRTWAIPFSVLVRQLPVYLDHFHFYLSTLTEAFIRDCGITGELVSGPSGSEV